MQTEYHFNNRITTVAQVLRTFDHLISEAVTEETEKIGINLMRRTRVHFNLHVANSHS